MPALQVLAAAAGVVGRLRENGAMVAGAVLTGEESSKAGVAAAVHAIVTVCAPRMIVLFGSVARGDAHAGSDIDLLVVIDDEADWLRAGQAALLAVARLDPEVDVIVTTQQRVDANRDRAGTIIRPALREGRVIYQRAA